METNPTSDYVLTKVIELCTYLESMEMHGFVMFSKKSSQVDVTTCGTNYGAQFIAANPKLGSAFRMFCTDLDYAKVVQSETRQSANLQSETTDNTTVTPSVEIKIKEEPVEEQSELSVPHEDNSVSSTGEKTIKAEVESESADQPVCNNQSENMKVLSDNDKQYCCSICNKVFKSKRGLIYHIPLHGPRAFKCEICNKEFFNRDGLKQHIKSHEPNKHMCSHCGKCFSKPYWLKRHEEVRHQNITSRKFECEMCGKKYSSRRILVAHIAKHTSQKSHECQTCGRHFGYKHSLERHMTACIINRYKGFHKCEICNKTFSHQRYLKQHKMLHETPKFSCNICGQFFTWKNCLEKHIQSCAK